MPGSARRMTLLVLLVLVAIGGGEARAATMPDITVFMAEPNADRSVVRIAALLEGDPDTPYQLFFEAGQCGEYGFSDFEPTDPVTTDAAGLAYFFAEIAPERDASTLTHLTISYGEPGDWNFFNCYPLGPDNTGWTRAVPVPLAGGSGSQDGEIALEGETRWYRFRLGPDASAKIDTDSGDVAVFQDIAEADEELDGTQDLLRLGASLPEAGTPPVQTLPSRFIPSRFIPSRFIPSRFIPSRFIPSRFIPSRFIGETFSGEAFSPSRFIGDAFAGDAFSPSRFIPSRFIPSRFIGEEFLPSRFIPATYSSAVTQSFVAAGFDGGDGATVRVNSWQEPGDYYVAVSGDDEEFQLEVETAGSGCESVTDVPAGTTPAVPATGRRTIVLTDPARLGATAADRRHLDERLAALVARPEVAGTVVDLGADARVQALHAQADANPRCPYAQTLVARAIKDVVDRYRAANGDLAYVVIAGGDDVIPFFRRADATPLGNERDYVPPVRDDSASQASLRRGNVLTDDPYGATQNVELRGQEFPLPGLAVGRLVETAPEIARVVEAYLTTNGGVVPTPRSSLVTSYDFLTPAAERVRADFEAGTGIAADVLFDPTPASAAPWTGSQLAQRLTGARHDLLFLGGHFSANNALAADFTTDVVTTELDASGVDLESAIVLSPGCHSGYNLVDGHAVPGVTLPLDWAQAFARKGATLVGGTGYQYGDTDFVEYSLRLYAGLASQLRRGTGPVPLGVALARAKQEYLEATPQLGDIHQKAVLETTLFGLPMTSVDLPQGRRPATGGDPSIVTATTPASSEPGLTLGLESADVSVTPTLAERTKSLDADTATRVASWLEGSSGVVANPHQPVLPLERRNVAVPGTVVRGVAFRGGRYADERDVTPLTGAPATETSQPHVGWDSEQFFPLRPWSVNLFGALARPGGPQQLMVTPAQHRGQSAADDTAVRRRFESLDFRLYYSDNTTTYGSGEQADTPARAGPPDVGAVAGVADPDGGGVFVCARVGGNPSAGVQEVFATWSDASAETGEWRSVDLAREACSAEHFPDRQDSQNWGGRIATGGSAPADVRFVVQAVNGVGLVAVSDAAGSLHSPLPPEPPGGTVGADFELESVTPGSVPIGDRVTVTARLDAGDYSSGQTIAFDVGGVPATATTDGDGRASVELPLSVEPGTYPVTARFDGALVTPPGEGPYRIDRQIARGEVTVTARPAGVELTRVIDGLAPGETRFAARLCLGGCDDSALGDRTLDFTLAGPVTRRVVARTDATGTATFAQYGLPPGDYTLTAAFAGDGPSGPGSASASFTTEFDDTEPPVLLLPAGISATATGADGTVVPYAVRATDDVDPRPVVTCVPPPISLFSVTTTSVDCVARDTAGNTAEGSFEVTVTRAGGPADPTAPVISPRVTGIKGLNGWYRTNVALSWAVSDPDSPVTSQTGCGPVRITSDQAPTSYTCTATSRGGQASRSVTIKRDTTAPRVTVTGVRAGAVYQLGSVPAAGCQTTDATSGVRRHAAPATVGGQVGTLVTACVLARDHAGNFGGAAASYAVRWPFGGFRPPVSGTALNTVRAGSGVLIKFGLGGFRGLNVLASPSSQRVACDTRAAQGSAAAARTSGVAYAAGDYRLDWATDRAWANTCRRFDLRLADGSTQAAFFRFTS